MTYFPIVVEYSVHYWLCMSWLGSREAKADLELQLCGSLDNDQSFHVDKFGRPDGSWDTCQPYP